MSKTQYNNIRIRISIQKIKSVLDALYAHTIHEHTTNPKKTHTHTHTHTHTKKKKKKKKKTLINQIIHATIFIPERRNKNTSKINKNQTPHQFIAYLTSTQRKKKIIEKKYVNTTIPNHHKA